MRLANRSMQPRKTKKLFHISLHRLLPLPRLQLTFQGYNSIVKLTDTIATIVSFKKNKDLGIIFIVVDKIVWKTTTINIIPTEKMNECQFHGKILLFKELVDGDIIWNNEYGPTVVCDGRLSIISTLHTIEDKDNFIFYFDESNFYNIKQYLSNINLNEFKSEIKKIDSPYSDEILNLCLIDSEEKESVDFNYKKVPCQVANCNSNITLVKMRMHIGTHILKNDVISHPHRCGFCGGIGCSLQLITTSGFGVNATVGPKSDCKYFYKFNMNKKSSKVVASYPCSNRPVHCDMCKGIYWAYNLESHYYKNHIGVKYTSLISEEESKLVRNRK